jgi:hypothetical protein
MLNKKVNSNSKASKHNEHKRHEILSRGSDFKESYVLNEELTKTRVSLNPFLTQVITKIEP